MNISIKLSQTWETAQELSAYLALLHKTIVKICELGEDTPKEWYFNPENQKDGSIEIYLTHL